MTNFYIAIGVLGTVMQLLVIYALTRGPFRQFPGVTFYLLVLFLTSVADMAVFLDLGVWPDWYRDYYYINNTVRHFAGFAAVVSLIYVATADDPNRLAHRTKVVVGTVGVIAVCFLLARGSTPGVYMSEATRNLSFSTVVLNLILWFSLIKIRAKDARLFMVSGGLGLNMTGEAIGHSLIPLSALAQHIGNLIGIGSHLLCLYIWWVAFRRREEHVRIPDQVTSQ